MAIACDASVSARFSAMVSLQEPYVKTTPERRHSAARHLLQQGKCSGRFQLYPPLRYSSSGNLVHEVNTGNGECKIPLGSCTLKAILPSWKRSLNGDGNANGKLRPHPRWTEEIKDNAFSHLRVHGWLEHTEGPVLERRENFEFVCLSSRPQWRS